MLLEAERCLLGEVVGELDVELRRDDRNVSHVGGEEGEFCSDVDARPVPAKQRVGGKGVPLILRAG
jgi:hypothetical protein